MLLGLDPAALKALLKQFEPDEEERQRAKTSAIMAAGLGMMSGRGNAWQNIGQGGLLGMQAYQQALGQYGDQAKQRAAMLPMLQQMQQKQREQQALLEYLGMNGADAGQGQAPGQPHPPLPLSGQGGGEYARPSAQTFPVRQGPHPDALATQGLGQGAWQQAQAPTPAGPQAAPQTAGGPFAPLAEHQRQRMAELAKQLRYHLARGDAAGVMQTRKEMSDLKSVDPAKLTILPDGRVVVIPTLEKGQTLNQSTGAIEDAPGYVGSLAAREAATSRAREGEKLVTVKLPDATEIQITQKQLQDLQAREAAKQLDGQGRTANVVVGDAFPAGVDPSRFTYGRSQSPQDASADKAAGEAATVAAKNIGEELANAPKVASAVVESQNAVNHFRDLLDKGVVTGIGAGFRVKVGQFANMLPGFNAESVSNSFAAQIAAAAIQLKNVPKGQGQISNFERELIAKAAAGDLSMDEKSLRIALTAMEKANKWTYDEAARKARSMRNAPQFRHLPPEAMELPEWPTYAPPTGKTPGGWKVERVR